MDAYEVIGHSDNRDEWLELRRSGIGGSDAPAILGLTNWASPASVQADKWGLLDEPEEAEHLRWGRRLEAAILGGLGEELGIPISSDGRLLRSLEHPFMLCTPDGRCADGVGVQAKNTMLAAEWQDGPPERVWVQCQHEMFVEGAPERIAAALLLGNRLVWQRVARDEEFIQDVLVPAARDFWKLTEAHEPVNPDGSEHTKRALQKLYPQDSGETVALDGHFIDLDNERLGLLEEKKIAEARLREIDNTFRHAMKDATFAALPNGTTFSLKTQTRKAHEVKESTFRVLRRAKAKENAA
jgi:predicted phage-related endonuclease